MLILSTFTLQITTVFLTVSILSTCNARRQHFSGSHSVDDDEDASATNIRRSSNVVAQSGHNSIPSAFSCPSKNVTEAKQLSCAASCTKDEDCENGFKCNCDGPCGLTCNKIIEEQIYCGFPGRIENGRVLVVGNLGLYDYRNQLKKFSHNQKIIFECDRDFTLSHGPSGKTCRNGLWLPAEDNPECVESDGPGFRWIRSARRKRKAIKTGGGTYARQNKQGGGGGGDRSTIPRRGFNRKNKRPGEDEDFSYGTLSCPSLDHDEYMQVELVQNGEDENNTYSVGAVAKISCTPGFGININNETVTCEKGRWRPKLPQCSALPCRVPYVTRGTFYNGSKPLFFQEYKNHNFEIELKCTKGYMVRGHNKLRCHFGEWDVIESPECVPAGCRIPHLEKGMYLMNYKPGMIVLSGTTEVDYVCDDNYQKPYSGIIKCNHGEWTPMYPKCISSELAMQSNYSLATPPVRKSCGNPPKDVLAIAYTEGVPLEYSPSRRFAHASEVMYRCVIIRPRAKNRWKITCNDGSWDKSIVNNIICEGNITDGDIKVAHEVTQLINSSCTYEQTDKNVVTFHNGQEIHEEQEEFPSGTVLVSRCVDIGKFQLKGAQRRKCVSGMWMGISPKCEGLSQYHDYAVDKSPTILFRFVNGSIAQTIDGNLIISPGITLHMECIYLRKFGRPAWEVSSTHRTYAEGWTDGVKDRDPTLEYRLTIDNATENDSGIYSCATPTRHSHQINIIVKKVECPRLPSREDIIYSTNSSIAGTKVSFSCKDSNSLVGNSDIQCQANGMWSGGLPRCEMVECPDISIVPAMVSIANTESTQNGTLKKNETAPPKITITNRVVGGKAIYTCPQGFKLEGGEPEAVCQANGNWAPNEMPLCKEVECKAPPEPLNGFVKKNGPIFKAGDLAEIECNRGFIIKGQYIIACQDNGEWSRPSKMTQCVPACTYPGSTIGGKISDVKFLYSIGEIIQFSCDEDYQLVGERELRCLQNQRWSHDVPKCVLKSGDQGHSSHFMGLLNPDNSKIRVANNLK